MSTGFEVAKLAELLAVKSPTTEQWQSLLEQVQRLTAENRSLKVIAVESQEEAKLCLYALDHVSIAICGKKEVEVNVMVAEVERLRQRLLTAAGDDLCRLSQEEIAAYTSGEVPIPPKEEFLPSCERFWEQMAATAGVNHGCLTLAQLTAENERMTAERRQCDERIANQRERITQLEQEAALRHQSACEQMAIIERLTAENEELKGWVCPTLEKYGRTCEA